MRVLNSEKNITVMSKMNEPVYQIKTSEVVVVKTLDCFSGKIKKGNQLLKDLAWNLINPATGPIYIDGSKKGDILKISILDIVIDKMSVVLSETEDMDKYDYKSKEESLFVEICNNNAKISNDISIPIKPMIGVIGTAPLNEDVPTTLPGLHGGNMDNTHITAGSVVYLPVNHDGALLALGDLHALMGNGESIGSGLEVAGEVTLCVEILRNVSLPLPMVETEEVIETVASSTTLDEAAALSVKNMLKYLTDNIGLSKEEAWKLSAACANVEICQFANALKTVRCTINKDLLRT